MSSRNDSSLKFLFAMIKLFEFILSLAAAVGFEPTQLFLTTDLESAYLANECTARKLFLDVRI